MRIRNAVFGLAVVGALGFGASSVAAAPAPFQTCTDPTAQGSCTSTSDCRKICHRLSNGLIPVCDTQTHCCTCQKL
jgi:hypothetical protein